MQAKRIIAAAAVISALCVPAFASEISGFTFNSNSMAASMKAPNPPKPAPQQPAPQKPQPAKPDKRSVSSFNGAMTNSFSSAGTVEYSVLDKLLKKDPPPPQPQPPKDQKPQPSKDQKPQPSKDQKPQPSQPDKKSIINF